MFVARGAVAAALPPLGSRPLAACSRRASLKYFLLGVRSAFFLFGAALLYGYAARSTSPTSPRRSRRPRRPRRAADPRSGVPARRPAVQGRRRAVPLVDAGRLPGRPTPVTGFMAACTKVAAFGAILRLIYVGLEANRWDWRMGVIAVAALTMVVGSVLSVTQTDVKRLLAYSSIAHAASSSWPSSPSTGSVSPARCSTSWPTASRRSRPSRSSRWSAPAVLRPRTCRSGPARPQPPVVAGVFGFLLGSPASRSPGFTAKYAAFCRPSPRAAARVSPWSSSASCAASSPPSSTSGSSCSCTSPSLRRRGRRPDAVAAHDHRGHRRRGGHPRARCPRPGPRLAESPRCSCDEPDPTRPRAASVSEALAERLQQGLADVDETSAGGGPRRPVHRRGSRPSRRRRWQAVPPAADPAGGGDRHRHQRRRRGCHGRRA